MWKDRHKYDKEVGATSRFSLNSCIQRNTAIGMKQVRLKKGSGRRRKHLAWVESLHAKLHDELDRLRQIGVKFSEVQ